MIKEKRASRIASKARFSYRETFLYHLKKLIFRKGLLFQCPPSLWGVFILNQTELTIRKKGRFFQRPYLLLRDLFVFAHYLKIRMVVFHSHMDNKDNKGNRDREGMVDRRNKGEMDKNKEKDKGVDVDVDKIGAHPLLRWLLLNLSFLMPPCFG